MKNYNVDVTVWLFMFTNKLKKTESSPMTYLLQLKNDSDPECFEFTLTLPSSVSREAALLIAKGLAADDGFNNKSHARLW